MLVTDRVLETRVLGFTRNPGFGLALRQVFNKLGIMKYGNFFWHISWFFIVGAVKLWKIIKYAKNLTKIEEKPCSICLKPYFFRKLPKTRVSSTRSVTSSYVHAYIYAEGRRVSPVWMYVFIDAEICYQVKSSWWCMY